MSDIREIQKRIAEIKSEIATDPELARDLEERSKRTHEAVRRFEEARTAKVVPISKARKIKSSGEVEL